MFRNALATITFLAILTAVAVLPRARAAGAYGSGAIDAQFVKTGLFVISGDGSNSILRLSADGLVVVDGKSAGAYRALRKKIRRISDQPVRLLITTDHQADRNGNNAQFRSEGASVVAHANALRNLVAIDDTALADGLPSRIYDGELVESFGGVEVRIIHPGPAHSDGDSVVLFPNLKAVAVGDLYTHAQQPALSAGGSFAGWSRALAAILALDFDVAIPSRGAPVTRSDVEAFKTHIDAIAAASERDAIAQR